MNFRVWCNNGKVRFKSLFLARFTYIIFKLIDLFYENRYSHTRMVNPDFVLLAQAMGVHAIRCHSAEELPAKMKEFLEHDGSRPVLMECLVDKNEHVFPMVCTLFLCFLALFFFLLSFALLNLFGSCL